jgi:hypothetical protein
MNGSIISCASDFAFEELKRSNDDLTSLSEPLLTLIVVESAQGLIDNGGLTYFFEEDFPGRPPFTIFSEAYRRIGALSAATCLDQATSLFPAAFLYDADARRRYMGEAPQMFEELDKQLCGCQEIWRCLEEYVVRNSDAFQKATTK